MLVYSLTISTCSSLLSLFSGSNKFFPDDTLDRNTNFEKEKKFSTHEYIALGLATLLIALIYIASVFLYLHFKKSKLKETSSRRSKAFKQFTDMEDNASHLFTDANGSITGQSKQLIVEQEGLVKNNPLLLKRYHSPTTSNHKSLLTSDEGCKFGSLHGDVVPSSTSPDQIDVYKPVGVSNIPKFYYRLSGSITLTTTLNFNFLEFLNKYVESERNL